MVWSGYHNAGKSTLFNALTNQNVLVADYPFATIDPTTGVVPLVDRRLDRLTQSLGSQRQIPATVTFVDIAGLVKGASQGEGLGNAFLAQIRSMAAIVIVLRLFQTPGSPHLPDPATDLAILNTELQLADHQLLTNQRQKLQRLAKAGPSLRSRLELMESALSDLDQQPLRLSPQARVYQDQLSGFHLLTLKPVICAFNLAADRLDDPDLASQLATVAGPAEHLLLSAELEAEISQLDSSDRAAFRAAYNLSETGLDRLKQLGFRTLGLQTFFTAGPKEARAWTIEQGWLAPRAAGVIHTDFEIGFIAADVIDWSDLVASGSWPEARARGQVRTEGKVYSIVEGEVVEFKFNRPRPA